MSISRRKVIPQKIINETNNQKIHGNEWADFFLTNLINMKGKTKKATHIAIFEIM